jgi:hypothetical protein
MKSLLYSRKFWIAVFALGQTILFQFVPDFSPAVWQAIDGLAAVLIATIAAEDVAEKSAAVYVDNKVAEQG